MRESAPALASMLASAPDVSGLPHRLPLHLAPALLVAALALSGASCSREAPQPRLVILYAPCSVSKHFLSPYAPDVRFTPHLSAFARDALVFERHMTEAGQSGIAYAALFSGVQADVHGAYHHPTRLDDHLYQISEAFRDAGYESFFWSGQRMGGYELGYGQGVPGRNAYLRRLEGVEDLGPLTANDARFDTILERLRRDPDYKAFVQIAFTVSHNPYHRHVSGRDVQRFLEDYPEERPDLDPRDLQRLLRVYARNALDLQWNLEGMIERGFAHEDVPRLAALLELLYEVSIHRLDTWFGRLVERVRRAGLDDESLIGFTSDHGEVLYRENALYHWTHGLQLAPEVMSVPWILRGPSAGVEPGRFEGVTRSIDVYPTMAALAGVPIPAEAPVDGVDLSDAVRGRTPEPDLLALFHTTTLSRDLLKLHRRFEPVFSRVPRDDVGLVWVGARRGDLVAKHVFDGSRWSFRVFDWAEDPGETRDLHDPDDPRHQALEEALLLYKNRLVHAWSGPSGSLDVDAVEKLRALGYVE